MIEAVGSVAASVRLASPVESLKGLDADGAGALLATSADVTLVLDGHGVIRDFAFADPDLARELQRDWVGRRWADTVAVESRPKIEDLMRDAAYGAPSRWRQVNYMVGEGPDIPVRFSAIRIGADRRVVAVGRDLRALAALQQRLAEAQQAVEREYARIRNAEKRYRLLFQLAAEAVLIVDSANQRIVEANPAAANLVGIDVKKLVGQSFGELFVEASRQAAQSFVTAARVAPRVDNVHVELTREAAPVLLSGALFRQEGAARLLVVLSRLGPAGVSVSSSQANLLKVVAAMPEAFVVTDPSRVILTANSAFLDLVQATTEQQVRGQPLDRWIGRPGVDIDVLAASLRAHGVVRQFSTIVRGEFGAVEDVEIAAVAALSGADPSIGLTIRAAGWRAGREKLGGRELPRTVEQFIDLVGRVPLKNLVRETTDLIERLCIEAALELTRDNRASAAEMLGLSRQGLYAKMRRYGLGDLEPGDEDA